MALDEAIELTRPDLAEEVAGIDFPETPSEDYFPTIKYTRHPYYAEFEGADETIRRIAADRFFESFVPLVRAEQAMADRVAKAGLSKGPPDAATSKALLELEDTGMYRFKLSPSETEEAIVRSEPSAEILRVRREQLAPHERGVEGVSHLTANSAAPDESFEFWNDLLTRHNIFALCEQYYQVPYKLKFVNLQMNSGEDTTIADVCSFADGRIASTYYMHIDSTIGAMKILMYRSRQVTEVNGAFRFVPRSHRVLNPVERAIRKANDKCGFDTLSNTSRRLLMGLPPYFRKKANFGNDLLPEMGFDNDSLLAKEMICEGEAGDGFMADTNGIHRGNLHKDPQGRREMFQILLIPT